MGKTLLLTGHRKSGTTLLHRLFDGHPECVVYPTDLGLLYAYLPCFAQNSDEPSVKRERISHVLEKSLSKFDGMSLGPMAGSHLSVQSFIGAVQAYLSDDDLCDPARVLALTVEAFRTAVQAHPAAVLVVKETSQAVHFERLGAFNSQLRLMGIVRDPRDNYAAIAEGVDSHYSRLGETGLRALASVINRARMDLLALHELTARSEVASSIRFEDLVSNPESIMKAAAEWLEIKFETSLLLPTQGKMAFRGNNFGGKQFSGISSQHVNAWRERLNEFEIGIIEYWLCDAMALWHYDPYLTKTESRAHFSRFYDWYNCSYFYHGTSFDL